jgi:hypothetical protein
MMLAGSICLTNLALVMLTTEVKEKFRKSLRKGEPDGEIRQQMESAGYTTEEIDEVFASVPEKSMGIWFIIGMLATFVYGFILFKKESGLLSLLSFFMSAICLQQFISLINKDKAKLG